MHMADALISPAVGGAMWAASAGATAWCARTAGRSLEPGRVPRMGVLGAFVFAAQMVNFAIPGTGSSGHLGGGVLLAVLLGPHEALLVIASVLAVQALFFADGGLLALGCNLFNLGFLPAFVALPLVYRPVAGSAPSGARRSLAALLASVAGLQLGALAVVLETTLSGISDLPFRTFLLLMLPIHLAIGLVEGLATAAILGFLAKARPELLLPARPPAAAPRWRPVLLGLLAAALATGGALSWLASSRPDGLEWSVSKAAGGPQAAAPGGPVHRWLARLQGATALLPGYALPERAPVPGGEAAPPSAPWPAADPGTSLSGIAGCALVLGLVALAGCLLRARRAVP